MKNHAVTIRDFKPAHQPFFEKFNREWIEEFFEMEPVDIQVLQHPEEYIISKGGCILMAYYDDTVVGTVALKKVNPGVFEFTKMAVDKNFRGLKIGQALGEAAIKKAESLKADSIILYSSTKLVPALQLYRKLGFKDVPVDGPYKRSDVKMELQLIDQ